MTPARAVDGMSSEFHKIAPHSPEFEQFQLDVVRKADSESSVIGVKRRAGSCTDASFPHLVNAPEGHRLHHSYQTPSINATCSVYVDISVSILTPILYTDNYNMKTPLRIAILQCDTPPPHVVELYGAYDRIFTTLLEKAASGLGLDPKKDLELSAFECVTAQEYPNIDDIDAVLISGSSKTTLSAMLVHRSITGVFGLTSQSITRSTTIHGF